MKSKEKSHKNLRLSAEELEAIARAFRNSFGSGDRLWLFGSRTDPSKKGGDLDFYIETREADSSAALEKKFAFVSELWVLLGEQKIDVILNVLPLAGNLPIYEIAKREGVLLL